MANPTEKPNKKPFQHYAQTEVVNMFAHVSGRVNAGTFVTIVAATADGLAQSYGDFTSTTPGSPNSRVSSYRASNPWKVRDATSGEIPLGMTLNDVREVNDWGSSYAYNGQFNELQAQDLILSGNSVPILKRGTVEINGFSGVPGPMSGAVIHPTIPGQLLVSNATTGRVGTFYTTSGADGYALFNIEL